MVDGEEVSVVPYEDRFEKDIVDICWETGLMGESLAGTGRFNDKRLFAMLFALPWLGFQPEICSVAVVGSGGDRRAVGYIIGTTDTRAEARFFSRAFLPRIAFRSIFLDSWLHPESARQVMRFYRARRKALRATARHGGQPGPGNGPRPGGLGPEGPQYPAELHINILPSWQGKGLGGKLMASFFAALRERGVPGVFLETSSRNDKALPFYRKLGFTLVAEEEGEFWAGLPAQGLTYILTLV